MDPAVNGGGKDVYQRSQELRAARHVQGHYDHCAICPRACLYDTLVDVDDLFALSTREL